MLKVLIWRVSNDTSFQDKAIKILEQQHNGIEIVGSSTGEDIGKVDWGGAYDVLLCVGAKKVGMSKVTQDAARLNLPEEKLLGDWIVCIPGFTLEKYRNLQNSNLSIISRTCLGGWFSHLFGLPFKSPFVNLFVVEPHFIKFMRSPQNYIEKKPLFEKFISASPGSPKVYPLLLLGDIYLHMMHYKDQDIAIEKWEERKQRINWDNVLVLSNAGNEKFLSDFDTLPYEKKACFVPFKSDLPSVFYINTEIDKQAKDFSVTLSRFGQGHVIYYDLFDLLLYGKKTPLIDM